MDLRLFGDLFPERAAPETRALTTRGYPGLPDDEYGLLDAYCVRPDCDCRRVMINVVARSQGRDFLASVSYGFEPDDEMRGPFLDPLNRQGPHAAALLELVATQLLDPVYLARLNEHYRAVKALGSASGPPARASSLPRRTARLDAPANRAERRRSRRR